MFVPRLVALSCFLIAALALVVSDGSFVEPDPAIYIYEEPRGGEDFFYNQVVSPEEIPLWPKDQVPSERPGKFGNESMICNDDECKDRHCRDVTVPTLTPYLVKSSDSAMVVAPGGGYSVLAFDREGTNIARWLNSIGISAFVLKYRVPARGWLPFGGAPLMDAQRAMGLVRNMAGGSSLPRLSISKIGFMGFSAGGHLTGHINVAYENRTYPLVDNSDKLSCKPDFSIMVYPWRSVSQPPVNEPISGASALNVTQQTPLTMLVQTQDDPVHVENSIYYYLALKNAGVTPSELHVYPKGGHGYGDCTAPKWRNRGEVCTWPDRAKSFLQALGVPGTTDRAGTDADLEELD